MSQISFAKSIYGKHLPRDIDDALKEDETLSLCEDEQFWHISLVDPKGQQSDAQEILGELANGFLLMAREVRGGRR